MSQTAGPAVPAAVHWLIVLLLFWVGLRWFERINLYIPSRAITAHPGTFGLKYEDLRLKASDGPTIHAWFIPNGPQSPALLVSHGNGGNMSHRMEKLMIFRKAGASVLMYDYRGYGQSSGSPTEEGTYRDGEAAYLWLTQVKGVPPERIVLYGESLGCGVAAELALRRKAAGLILESGFTSTVDMARVILPFLPVSWMVLFRYDSLAKIPRIRIPLLVMHSPTDDVVPFPMGRQLFEAALEPKTFFELKGDHNEGFLETGKPYEEAIHRFLGDVVK